ncbi:DUF4349 domain-containing protein [Streptomyces sp. ISL-66]|uniref:DUF4349 domain-containing protein n=1 Tax=Streptomyces sp. ISL-66 TaxID=2819186 RepID=UPI001BE76F8D|nr:DUF4349 domain-containing protein [Streptomyces sp. ISL-66]MBT2472640.1 DUF4349 domain-containing protein [Streptomyces sp. ISL-66]
MHTKREEQHSAEQHAGEEQAGEEHAAGRRGASRYRTRRYGRRPATALAALSLAGALALAGCSAGSDGKTAADAGAPRQQEAAGQGPAAAPAAPGAPAPSSDKNRSADPVRTQIIRTATLSMETADAQKATAGARAAAENAGGYVGNESTKRGADGVMTSTVTLRVPGDRFDAVLGAMEGSGKLLDRKVEAQDVTQKVADIDSRVRTQQASVARVREMMEKASGLADVVTLESELSKRQSDLESLLAQQTALKDQTSLGTITLTFSEPAKAREKAPEKEPGFLDALFGGWYVFGTLIKFLLMALAASSPFLLAGAVLLVVFRQVRKWRPAKEKPDAVRVRRVPAQTGPLWPAPPVSPSSASPSAASPAPSPAAPANPPEGDVRD